MTETFVFPSKAKRLAYILIGVGFIGLILGFFVEHDSSRIWANLLLNSYYFLGISLTGVFLAAAHQIGYGGWHIQLKRIFESTGAYIPFLGAVVILILVAAYLNKDHFHLYHWLNPEVYDPESSHYDKILAGKRAFLNFPFFAFRLIFYILLWSFLAWLLWKVSVKEDEIGGLKYYKRNKAYAAIFIVIFAITSSTSSWDFIMSIDPHWYSTLFGWYNFASYAGAGVAAITLIVLFLKSQGYLEKVGQDHFHNLGLFMFGFSVFWAYLWFSQYMLQWYANIPEETIYFEARLQGRLLFKILFYLNIICCFFFPFLFLMTRAAKRNPRKLLIAASVIIFGHWVDYYLMVMPGGAGEHAGLGFIELFVFSGFAGGYILVVLSTLTKASLVPVNHPFLRESIYHHTLK